MSDRLDRHIKQLFEELDRAAPHAPPPPELPELELAPAAASTRRRRTQGWVVGLASAAVILLVFGLAGLLRRDGEGAADLPTTIAASAETTVPDLSPTVPDVDVDESGAAPTAGTPPPDVEGASPGDDGEGPMPLGTITTLPDTVRLDFLFEFCGNDVCWRDAHFVDPENPDLGSGPFMADTPFHVRHGFVNENDEPLGDGFDLVLYVTEVDEVGELGGRASGETFRYTSDYVTRGTTDACGPTYRSQTGPVTCEWFVHEFNEGLPRGRHALWAFWEAPCRAWLDYGFTDSCADPDEILSLFSSGVDSPYSSIPPVYDEIRAR
jgi:hypothetical protein